MAETNETVETWAQTYLAARGIDAATAQRYGVRVALGGGIDRLTSRNDGNQIQGGIWFPYKNGGRLRCYAPVVYLNGQAYAPFTATQVKSAVFGADPRNAPINDEWKIRYANLPGWHAHPAAGQLIEVTDAGEVERRDYYPHVISAEARELATQAGITLDVAKFICPKGQAVQLYAPESPTGERPLIVCEGETRALAVLAAGATVDVVGIAGISQWHARGAADLLPELKAFVKVATRVIIAIDGDFVTNPSVARQLLKLVAAVRAAKEGIDVRICVPQICGDAKAGLDDVLGSLPAEFRKTWIERMVDDAFPASVWGVVKQLRTEQFEVDESTPERAGRPRDPADMLALARDGSLTEYEALRRALADLHYSSPPHPFPEGRLHGVDNKGPRRATLAEVAQTVPIYLAPSLPFLAALSPRGQVILYRVTDGIVRRASADALKTAIADRLAVLLGDRPTSKEVAEAYAQFLLQARAVEIAPIRAVGETHLAYSELPNARPGDLDAWDEFLSRLSCRDTFLAWLHTLSLPEAATGRQALYLRGSGHDGKSTVIDVLCSALGAPHSDVAVTVSDISSRDKFAFAGVRPWTRLLFLDDVRNSALLHYKAVRNLLAGATMAVEQKFKDAELMRLHPRILVASNIQLRFDLSNRAEATRVLQVDVAPRSGAGDADWPKRLKEELPALLAAAAEAYARIADQTDIRLTPATKAAMQAGQDESEDRFDAILPRIKLVPDGRTPVASLRAALDRAGIVDERGTHDRTNFYRWLEDRGCRRSTGRIDGKPAKVWSGVLLLAEFTDEEFTPTTFVAPIRATA